MSYIPQPSAIRHRLYLADSQPRSQASHPKRNTAQLAASSRTRDSALCKTRLPAQPQVSLSASPSRGLGLALGEWIVRYLRQGWIRNPHRCLPRVGLRFGGGGEGRRVTFQSRMVVVNARRESKGSPMAKQGGTGEWPSVQRLYCNWSLSICFTIVLRKRHAARTALMPPSHAPPPCV